MRWAFPVERQRATRNTRGPRYLRRTDSVRYFLLIQKALEDRRFEVFADSWVLGESGIRNQIKFLSAAVVIIGPKWRERARDLDSNTDAVRLELEAVLETDIPLVPLLVPGAWPPEKDELPESLQRLADLTCFNLSDERLDGDVKVLVHGIESSLRAHRSQQLSQPVLNIGPMDRTAGRHDVFISYSMKDKVVGDAVCATLEAKRIRCWIAPRDILPGQEWGRGDR